MIISLLLKCFHTPFHYGYSTWEAEGAKDMTQRTQEKMRDILNSHQPQALADDKKKAIDKVLAAAEESLN